MIENNETEMDMLKKYSANKFTKEEISSNKNNKELQQKIYLKSIELISNKENIDIIKKGLKILKEEIGIINKNNDYFSTEYSALISLTSEEIVNDSEHMFEIAVFKDNKEMEKYRYYIDMGKNKIIRIVKN